MMSLLQAMQTVKLNLAYCSRKQSMIVSAEVAGGNFPDMVDCGLPLSLAAISQGLVLDLKPYIDENNLQDAVGLNYTQNDVDGHIYTVHDPA